MKIVIGASGYIGSNLIKKYSKDLLVGTYTNHQRKGLEYFNLENPDLKQLKVNIDKADTLFLCSSICKIIECKRNEEKARRINVDGTKKVLEQCFNLGILPVFFSSDQVFDGRKGNYTEEDKTNPTTVYGKHKKEIEDFLLNSNKPFLIARLSMIYGGDGAYIKGLTERLDKGEIIKQAIDQKLTPTHIDDLVNVLDICLEKRLDGLYNITASESYSRYDLANLIKKKYNIKTGKIVPCSIREFDFIDIMPTDIGLRNDKIIKATNYEFRSIR